MRRRSTAGATRQAAATSRIASDTGRVTKTDGAATPTLETARRRLAALQDPTRLRLAYAILRNPVATSELATQLGMTAPQVSRHLRRLREAQLVHTHRRGSVVYHQLDADAVERLGPDLLSVLYR